MNLVRFDVDNPKQIGELEAALSGALGCPVRITGIERIQPSAVVRCHLAAEASSTPATVMVKWLREDPSGVRTDPARILTERAALDFLAGLGLALAPRQLAAGEGWLIIEDLAPRIRLADLLLRHHGEAEVGLKAFARALGELHTATAGLADDYYAGRRALGPADPRWERERFLGRGWDDTCALFEGLGVAMPTTATADTVSLREAFAEPGPFLAFSNGDASFYNFLVHADDGRFIDFESAGYQHALADAACLHVPNSQWLTVGDPHRDGTEAEYRQVLSRGVPEAEDDSVFGFGMAASCLAMAIERLSRFPRLDARGAGDESRQQMLATLEAACHAAEHHRSLPHLTGWMRRVIDLLRQRWPDADFDMTRYEPFTPRVR